jgi:hypothetical protein
MKWKHGGIEPQKFIANRRKTAFDLAHNVGYPRVYDSYHVKAFFLRWQPEAFDHRWSQTEAYEPELDPQRLRTQFETALADLDIAFR